MISSRTGRTSETRSPPDIARPASSLDRPLVCEAYRDDRELGRHTALLDGDNLRHGINRDLGFTTEARVENMRRVTEIAALLVDTGLITLVSLISPFRSERETARQRLDAGEFVEIHIATPLADCESRDPKGLYRRARAGELPNFHRHRPTL